MKKTLISFLVLSGVASAADLVAEWTSFENFDADGKIAATTGEYNLIKGTKSGDSSVTDGVLTVNTAGANGLSVDLSEAALTMDSGITFSFTLSNIRPKSSGTFSIFSFNTTAANHVFAIQSNTSQTLICYDGSYNNGYTHSSVLEQDSDTPITLTVTVSDMKVALYVDGEAWASGSVNATNDYTGQTIKELSLGAWAGTSDGQLGNSKVYDLAIYNGAMTADEVKALMVPEPTTATLSLLALVGLAARRRRK